MFFFELEPIQVALSTRGATVRARDGRNGDNSRGERRDRRYDFGNPLLVN
jgi:hypothetical protein